MIDIIIIGDSNSELTQNCIASISLTTDSYNIIIIPFDGNYNQALNLGLKKSKADYVALCNNDLIFHDGWFKYAKNALQRFDSISPFDPLHHEETFDPVIGFEIAKALCGWCIITTKQTIKKIGGRLDTSAKFWRSDFLYGKQLQKANLTHAMIPSCKVSHLGSQTLKTLPEHKQRELTINEFRKFRSRV